jgi:hypothetical protein
LKINDKNSRIRIQDPDPDQNPLVRGMDPRIRIRIHTKMSWIRNTGGNRTAPTCVVGGVGAAVVGRLGHHVREVDSLAEHVARHRGFGGRNPQTLQTTDVKTIPMKPAVMPIESSS